MIIVQLLLFINIVTSSINLDLSEPHKKFQLQNTIQNVSINNNDNNQNPPKYLSTNFLNKIQSKSIKIGNYIQWNYVKTAFVNWEYSKYITNSIEYKFSFIPSDIPPKSYLIEYYGVYISHIPNNHDTIQNNLNNKIISNNNKKTKSFIWKFYNSTLINFKNPNNLNDINNRIDFNKREYIINGLYVNTKAILSNKSNIKYNYNNIDLANNDWNAIWYCKYIHQNYNINKKKHKHRLLSQQIHVQQGSISNGNECSKLNFNNNDKNKRYINLRVIIPIKNKYHKVILVGFDKNMNVISASNQIRDLYDESKNLFLPVMVIVILFILINALLAYYIICNYDKRFKNIKLKNNCCFKQYSYQLVHTRPSFDESHTESLIVKNNDNNNNNCECGNYFSCLNSCWCICCKRYNGDNTSNMINPYTFKKIKLRNSNLNNNSNIYTINEEDNNNNYDSDDEDDTDEQILFLNEKKSKNIKKSKRNVKRKRKMYKNKRNALKSNEVDLYN